MILAVPMVTEYKWKRLQHMENPNECQQRGGGSYHDRYLQVTMEEEGTYLIFHYISHLDR